MNSGECHVLRFEKVRRKGGRWPRQKNAEDKREVVLADGKPVLRDLALWMRNQKIAKSSGKLIPFREKVLKLTSHSDNKRKRQADPSSSSSSSSKRTKIIFFFKYTKTKSCAENVSCRRCRLEFRDCLQNANLRDGILNFFRSHFDDFSRNNCRCR